MGGLSGIWTRLTRVDEMASIEHLIRWIAPRTSDVNAYSNGWRTSRGPDEKLTACTMPSVFSRTSSMRCFRKARS
jgi:hypothetical protein